MTYKYKTAVFIGRFQPCHKTHIQIIKHCLSIAEKIIISIGSYKRPRTIKNPWTGEERIEMILEALAEDLAIPPGWTDKPHPELSRISFIQVRDHMYNDTHWMNETYNKALQSGATQDKTTVLVGNFKDDSSYYLNMYPQWSLETVPNLERLNATDIRNVLFEQDNPVFIGLHSSTEKKLDKYRHGLFGNFASLKQDYDFIKKYKESWSKFPYPPTFVTVDTVVIKSGHVLMIKRGANPGKGLWALPGGFLNQDERLEQAAIRELKEETRISLDRPTLKRSIIDSKVFDHPSRSLRGRTITHAFLIDLGSTGELPVVKADDDAALARWIPLADLWNYEEEMFEDHSDIIKNFTTRF